MVSAGFGWCSALGSRHPVKSTLILGGERPFETTVISKFVLPWPHKITGSGLSWKLIGAGFFHSASWWFFFAGSVRPR